ncbi:LytR/AlgR family response regulator transcription factor [Fusobacterium gastrosuis]|uniref:LytR/AlgR family response regulator transcription factor n=1 Tax=Fusobacterium gastrosuis TaxID=1755100 RepID=UPI002971259B|nr:LytTR family DNA-binding domain-containing protein [Fusobacteriaceae bacterium]MDY5713176.1 LytTR family DNA-binding domain-containing protein [Fusobacterium gastrosuis]
MINCIIVEDELPAREELKFFLEQESEINLVAEFDNPIDALNFIESNSSIDGIFLDINMPDMNGLSLSKIITKINPRTKIIFITAYKEYAVDAFEIKAFDYLLKPYSEARIKNLLKSLISSTQNTLNLKNKSLKKITVNIDDKLHVLSLKDIDFIEAFEKESHIFSNEKIYISKIKISKWQEMLEDFNFYRCHRSYIVNLDKITEIEQWVNSSWVIKIKNYSNLIPVSRNNIKELKDLFSIE